ncbi:MAG TPA: hypothetical protein VGT40_18175 [Methylomirabilota bacterium]|nr:hypothetical protein [Methylomirabilota bacterium]
MPIFLRVVLAELEGHRFGSLVVDFPITQALPLAPGPVVGLLQMIVVVGFFVLSVVAGHRLSLQAYPDPRTASRALVPMTLLSLVFTVAGIVLLLQPMGMRHGM